MNPLQAQSARLRASVAKVFSHFRRPTFASAAFRDRCSGPQMRPPSTLSLISPPAHARHTRPGLSARRGGFLLLGALIWSCVLHPWTLNGETVRVSHKEGLVHGFLVLQTLEG